MVSPAPNLLQKKINKCGNEKSLPSGGGFLIQVEHKAAAGPLNKETDYAACIRVTCYTKKTAWRSFLYLSNYLSL